MGDGDGWVTCRRGHRHWGRFGAAGILVTDTSHVLLALRASWTHEGGSWALPGGAVDPGESATEAALRELGEETTLSPESVGPFDHYVDDHGGWAYTTVLAAVGERDEVAPRRHPFHGRAVFEHDAVGWFALSDVAGQRLHSGFAAAWPTLLETIALRAQGEQHPQRPPHPPDALP